VRDSSLSAPVQAIMAAEVGMLDLAYDYLAESALVDLHDLKRNSRDGLHLASLAGAWSALVAGFGGMRRVVPVRGQMLRLAGGHLGHAIAGPEVYLVPRGDSTIVGSTFEYVGFDPRTTESAIARLRDQARLMVPDLEQAAVADSWAGLRPVTPDGLPIIGVDPDVPSLIYACGHGKNGILLAPITGECVAALAGGTSAPVDLELFSASRFE